MSPDRIIYSFVLGWVVLLAVLIALDWLGNPNRGTFRPKGDRPPRDRGTRRSTRRGCRGAGCATGRLRGVEPAVHLDQRARAPGSPPRRCPRGRGTPGHRRRGLPRGRPHRPHPRDRRSPAQHRRTHRRTHRRERRRRPDRSQPCTRMEHRRRSTRPHCPGIGTDTLDGPPPGVEEPRGPPRMERPEPGPPGRLPAARTR